MNDTDRRRLWMKSLILTSGLGLAVGCLFLGGHVLAAAPSEKSVAAQNLAGELFQRTGIRRGLCVVLGDDVDVPLEIAQGSELLVHVRSPQTAVVETVQKQGAAAGLGITRLTAEQGPLANLPHADNVVDIVVAPRMTTELLESLLVEEVLRALRPRGTALVGYVSAASADENRKKLQQWVGAEHAERIQTWDSGGLSWIQFSKPALKGAGEWTHWEHGPDNNPVSADTIIKAPYMTQFMAKPYYIAMPSITTAAGGRTFLAIGHIAHHRREWDMMNKLIARNGYNGTLLWERKLPEGYLVHRSAFIATQETFYMLDGSRCLLLDPETGREKGAIRIPGLSGEWKWMVLKQDFLYVLAGRKDPRAQITKGDRSFGGWSWSDLSRGYYSKPHVPWGFGDTLAAYDLKKKEVRWIHKEEKPIDSRGMSMGEDRLTVYCPQQHFRCLDLKTGKVLWTNQEKDVLGLIEEPGKGLTSTPGFRTACLAVYTPDAIIIQGQTRMNVVALSTVDGYQLWTKKKVTNNPNAIYVDGNIVLGVGPGGSHVVVEPTTGKVLEDLQFRKRACTRLTACSDSFFVRGEGTLRYDRVKKKVLVDGAARPACNDGALPANGLLYIGPWQCDCNLSLIGRIGKCSAGDFRFDRIATEADRLRRGAYDIETVAPLQVGERDWPTYRGNNSRSSSTTAPVAESISQRWEFRPPLEHIPTVPISAGGLVFIAGEDGKVCALDANSGAVRWEFATPSPIKAAPTVTEGRVLVGGGDGQVYALEATTGRLLWRFRAAPVDRHILVYGALSSTWPVNSGVLVEHGTAYFAAGIIDYDGTYIYALDAETGEIEWQNNSSGHLNGDLRKGVSAQGNLTIQGNRLLLASGNQVSPAPFDLQTGECLAGSFDQGQPKTNNGQYVGVFRDGHAIVGGRILYSAPQNVSTKGSFHVISGNRTTTLNFGGIPPAWDDNSLVLVNYQHGQMICCDADKVEARMQQGSRQAATRRRSNLADAFAANGAVRWQSNLGESDKFEAVSLAVCPNAVVAVVQYQQKFRAQPQWFVVAFNTENGSTLWRQEIRAEPLPGGLLVDRDGQVVVTMVNGTVLCLGGKG